LVTPVGFSRAQELGLAIESSAIRGSSIFGGVFNLVLEVYGGCKGRVELPVRVSSWRFGGSSSNGILGRGEMRLTVLWSLILRLAVIGYGRLDWDGGLRVRIIVKGILI
jgi:hypothetical protein